MAFVKFSRGLLSVYNKLSKKDPDTLYLVYENDTAEDGFLYLGNKLISGVGTSSSLSLNDLVDVNISESIKDGALLLYNASTTGTNQGQWESIELKDFISDLPNTENKVSVENSLADIENPSEKDIAIIGLDVYIYKDHNWKQLSDSTIKTDIVNLKNEIGHKEDIENNIPASGLYKEIADFLSNVYTKEEIATLIANAAHLHYEIVDDISKIDVSDSDKVSNTIFLVLKNDTEESNNYDEYFVINNALEKIGNWQANLNNYVTKDSDQLLTDDLKKKIDSLGLDENNLATIQASLVGNLTDFIQDALIIKSIDPGSFEITKDGELKLTATPSVSLDDYMKTIDFESKVGNLSELKNRVNDNSTLVQEINAIKNSIIWQELVALNASGN